MNSWRRRSCALSAARAFSLGRRSFVFPPPPTLRRREGPLAHSPDILVSVCGRRLAEIGNTNAARTCTRRKLRLRSFAHKAPRPRTTGASPEACRRCFSCLSHFAPSLTVSSCYRPISRLVKSEPRHAEDCGERVGDHGLCVSFFVLLPRGPVHLLRCM